MTSSFDPQFQNESPVNGAALPVGSAGESMGSAVRGQVVNRTHRVVRQRAKQMRARRSYMRSLTVPLILCSALLILAAIAVWSGMYRYQAADAVDAVQADVAAIANSDLMDQLMVVLLWFVPVSLALLATVWFRRTSADRGALR